MVSIRKLSPEETEAALKPTPRVDLSTYLDALRGLQPDEWAELIPGNDEPIRLVKRRLTMAATLLGKGVRYRVVADKRTIFTATTTKPTRRTSQRSGDLASSENRT